MDDQNDPEGDHHDDAEYEVERRATRSEAAAVLRQLADGVEGGAVTVGEDDDAVTVDVPERFVLELECEREDDEVEVEVEMEWPRWATDGETAPELDGDADGVDGEDPAETVDPAWDSPDSTGDESDESAETTEDEAIESGDETDEDPPWVDADDDAADGDGGSVPDVETLVDPAGVVESSARFELYRDRADKWRWRLRHRNGNVIADGGQGYARKRNAKKGLESVMVNAPGAAVVEDD